MASKKKKETRSAIEIHREAIAIDAKNRCDAATKEYNEMLTAIKKKYNVVMVHSGRYSAGTIENYLSFQSTPVSLTKPM